MIEYRVVFEAIQFDVDGTHGGENWWKPVARNRPSRSRREAEEEVQRKLDYPAIYRNIRIEERCVTITPWTDSLQQEKLI